MTHLPKGWISKPMADAHKGDAKSNKLCIIAPIGAHHIELHYYPKNEKNGHAIFLRYYGTYEGGGYRYYYTAWGYQVAEHAMSLSGCPLCEVWANGKKYGVINPGFREGGKI